MGALYGFVNRKTLKNLLTMYRDGAADNGGRKHAGVLRKRKKLPERERKEALQFFLLLFMIFVTAFIVTENIFNTLLITAVGLIALLKIKEIADDRRKEKINSQLANVLVVVANSLKAGASLSQAWSNAAPRAEQPIRNELMKIDSAIKLGFPPEEALRMAKNSIATKEYDLVVTATSMLVRTGGNMAEVYENISAIIKERLNFRRAATSSTTYLRLTAAVTTALPLISLLWVRSVNPGYFDPLVAQYGGMVYVIYFAMVCIGWIIIQRILYVQID